ncbi:helix-turn-helix transcriptional regulator [Lactobacillus sp. ESL0259]|uniref:helix-turn-helix transcriptional regulator n=1 Tax=Lactobacillus sp. ESL0259 TaxID=2069346 RepID=UPI000EFB55A0|nr:helix-turn-helix domain-containing protein [Lactobacillus sp. ESL0259]RMC59815.1 helix-turn-helix domain-containing protein [Lactobacillus sp. ESL0259]
MKSRIAQLRKKQRYSQAQFAAAAHVTRQTINSLIIENDKYDPSLGLAFHLAQI